MFEKKMAKKIEEMYGLKKICILLDYKSTDKQFSQLFWLFRNYLVISKNDEDHIV